jgi:hypothetical protein
MPEKRYRILFGGKIAKGRDVEEVKRNLTSLFKLAGGKIEQFFTGRQVVIKKNLSFQSAMKYKVAFETAGAVCRVQEVDSGPTMARHPETDKNETLEVGPADIITCPKCGFEQQRIDECRQCGVIINKYSETGQNLHQATRGNASPLYFAVSKPKFIVMSLCTGGIYELYWFYKNWKIIKQRTRQNIRPFWRTFFAIFYCHSLFKSVQGSASSPRHRPGINPGWLAAAYIALSATWRLPDPFWFISSLTFLPLLPVQGLVNRINARAAPAADRNSRFSTSNIIVIIIGGIFLSLAALEPFLPSSFLAENGQTAWEEFTCEPGNFAVSFPGKPEKETQTFNTPFGKMEQQVFGLEKDGSTAYLVSYIDFPGQSTDMIDRDQFLDAARDGMVEEYGARVTNETTIQLDYSYPGREVAFEGALGSRRFSGRSRIFLVEQRLYQLMILGEQATVDEEDADRFFLSFEHVPL